MYQYPKLKTHVSFCTSELHAPDYVLFYIFILYGCKCMQNCSLLQQNDTTVLLLQDNLIIWHHLSYGALPCCWRQGFNQNSIYQILWRVSGFLLYILFLYNIHYNISSSSWTYNVSRNKYNYPLTMLHVRTLSTPALNPQNIPEMFFI